MTAPLTAYGAAYMLDALLAAWAADGVTTYAQLTTTEPTKATAGTAATGVPRAAIALARTDEQLLNSAEVDFGEAGADEDYRGLDIYDAPTGGHRIIGGPTSAPITATTGQPVTIPAGSFAYAPDASS